MKWLYVATIILLCGLAYALAPIQNVHEKPGEVDNEFRNIYETVQPRQMAVFKTTPTLIDLQDGEAVIYSSGMVRFMFRSGEEIWSVSTSCITIRR